MKNFLTSFIVFMIWSLFGLWIYSWVQPENIAANVRTDFELQDDKIIESSIDTIALIKEIPIFEIKEDSLLINNKKEKLNLKAINSQGDIIFIFDQGIEITKNSLEVFIPEASKDFKYKINSYLLEHPNQEVHINSIYSPQENVINPNIGIQRANRIENSLISLGIPKEKIIIKSIIKQNIFSEEGKLDNGFYFTFEPIDLERVNAILLSIPEKRIVYPKFAGSGVAINNELKLLLEDLKEYFKTHPNKKVYIIGHTDNIGNSADNYAIGLKYAKQVRWYLISEGNINKSSIVASSKGESEPLDTNNSNQGRNYNRRIEVIFK